MSIRSNRDFRVFVEALKHHNRIEQVGDVHRNPTISLMDAYRDYNAVHPSWPGIITLEKQFKMDQSRCKSNISQMNQIFSTVTDFFAGPFKWKNGSSPLYKGIDFWSTYFCPNIK